MNVSMTAPNSANQWQPPVRNYAPPSQPEPTDGYRPGGRPLADTVSRYTAVGATALTLAAICGASEGVMTALGVPVAIGGVTAVVLSFVGKDNSIGALRQHGSLIDKSARLTAFSALAAGVASAAGGGDGLSTLLALPAVVGGPVATGLWIKEGLKGRQQNGNQAQQPPAPVSFQPPTQQQAPPAPIQFGQQPGAPVQFGTNQPPAAPVQFGAPTAQGTQQQAGPPEPPTFNGKPYWQS